MNRRNSDDKLIMTYAHSRRTPDYYLGEFMIGGIDGAKPCHQQVAVVVIFFVSLESGYEGKNGQHGALNHLCSTQFSLIKTFCRAYRD
jgi:hypothetical protein